MRPVRYNARVTVRLFLFLLAYAGFLAVLKQTRQFSSNGKHVAGTTTANLWLVTALGNGNDIGVRCPDDYGIACLFSLRGQRSAALVTSCVTNALIILCGITGLFASSDAHIPHSLFGNAAEFYYALVYDVLAEDGNLCGGMLLVWRGPLHRAMR